MSKIAYFGVYYAPAGVAPVLCEVDGGVSYEAHTTKKKAEESAKQGNDINESNGHGRNYVVMPIPAGVQVWNRDTDRQDTSGAHVVETPSPYSASLVQLRKCVLLRREYDNAIYKMVELMDGRERDSLTGEEVALIDEGVRMLNDGADNPSDVGADALDDLIEEWKGR